MPHWILHALDGLSSTCPEYCLHFWGVLGAWLAAIATLSAVLVSLALARRTGVRINVEAGVRLLIQPGQDGPWPELVAISVRNIGDCECTIEGIGWRFARWIGRGAMQNPSVGPGYPRLPHALAPDARVTFIVELDPPWDEELARHGLGRWPWLAIWFVKAQAWTPAGVIASARIDRALRQRLLKAHKRSQSKRAEPAE